MTETQKPFVIGVSSPSGGGKTTLVTRLARRLHDVVVLSFDAYDEAGTVVHPPSIRSWLKDGADYNAWQTPRLTRDLESLISGNPICPPPSNRSVRPPKWVLFDAPLGRAHRDTGEYIDLMVYVDTPLDVAMARRIVRDCYRESAVMSNEKSKELRQELERYLEFARAAYLEMERQVKPTCDLVVDGLLAPGELASRVVEVTLRRFPRVH